jgi:septum formation protein
VRLVLASGSPQRRAILEQLGVEFDVRPAGVDELGAGDPEAVALENARRKALAVAPAAGGATVLGADTLVTVDGRILGKPRDEREAAAFLHVLGGRTHEVVSALAVIEPGRPEPRAAAARSRVTFRELDEAWVEWYLATGEWAGRAGGYAIQGRGAALVSGVEGDYLGVVGLPVSTLIDLLPELVPYR